MEEQNKKEKSIGLTEIKAELEKYRKTMEKMYWIFLVVILFYDCLGSTPLFSYLVYLFRNSLAGMGDELGEMIVNSVLGLRYIMVLPAIYTIVTEPKDKKTQIVLTLMLLFGWFYSIYWREQNDTAIFEMMLLIVASYGKDIKKILKISMIIASSVMIMAFLLWAIGFLPDYTIQRGDMIRHSFGTIYCTDLAAHWCFIILSYIFLVEGKIKWPFFVAIAVLSVINILFVGGRISLLCVILAVMGSVVYSLFRRSGWKIPDKLMTVWKWLMLASYGILAAVYLIMNFTYSQDSGVFYNRIPFLESLAGRLNTSWRVTTVFPISPFGKYFIQIGDGFGEKQKLDIYTFLDCSYIRVYVMYGVIALVVVLAVFTAIQYRLMKKGKLFAMFIMAIIAVDCLIEHHMIEAGYNVFMLLLFAALPGDEEKSEMRAVTVKGGTDEE